MEGYGFLLNILNQCVAPITRQCINHKIHTSSEFTDISGKISVDANGKADHTLFINTIKQGELKVVVKVN